MPLVSRPFGPPSISCCIPEAKRRCPNFLFLTWHSPFAWRYTHMCFSSTTTANLATEILGTLCPSTRCMLDVLPNQVFGRAFVRKNNCRGAASCLTDSVVLIQPPEEETDSSKHPSKATRLEDRKTHRLKQNTSRLQARAARGAGNVNL